MHRSRTATSVLVATIALCLPISAHAQTAAAEALFEEGRSLMETGDYARACPKLAESQRLDPASGTLLNLGICYQKAGKTASSWEAFKEAVVLARRDDRPERVAFAEEQIAALEPALSYVTVSVAVESRIEGLQVRIDGVSLGAGAWDTPIPANPGNHRVDASAPGHATWWIEVEVGATADKKTVVIPPLALVEVAETAPSISPTPTHSVTPTPAERNTEDAGVQGGHGQATLGYVIGGVGIAALGVGTYFGVKALSSWSDRNAHCNEVGCDGDAVVYGDDANKFGTIANVGVGAGLVGIGVGTYLLLTAPSAAENRAGVAQRTVFAGRRALLRTSLASASSKAT